MPIRRWVPYNHQSGRAGGSHHMLQGMEAAPQAVWVSLSEPQQAGCSLPNSRVLCAHHHCPLCCVATDPNSFETATSAVVFIPNRPRYNSSLAQRHAHKGALLNEFYVKRWTPQPVLNTRWIIELSYQKALYCSGLCHSLSLESDIFPLWNMQFAG